MKKAITFISLISLLVAPVFGQKAFRVGVRGGYDFIDRTINKDILNASNRSGYHAGLSFDMHPPVLPFGVNLSVLYTQQDFKNQDDYTFEKAYFLDVPVDLTCTIGLGSIGVVLSAGPYIRFNLDGGDIKLKSISEAYKAQTFQAGANFGAGVNLGSHLYIGATYFTNLTENYKETDPEFEKLFHKKPDRMALTAAYYF